MEDLRVSGVEPCGSPIHCKAFEDSRNNMGMTRQCYRQEAWLSKHSLFHEEKVSKVKVLALPDACVAAVRMHGFGSQVRSEACHGDLAPSPQPDIWPRC
jgi:hypothetical protein